MGLIEHKKFNIEEQKSLGSKFLISNGYLGYRGTLDEHKSLDFVALNLNGLFDGETIKESVNAYNPLFTVIRANGIILNPMSFRPTYHEISLDTDNGVFRRRTDFIYGQTEISLKSERFADQTDKNLIYSKYMFMANKYIEIELTTGIDMSIWNISENHLINPVIIKDKNSVYISSNTKHHHDKVVVGLDIIQNFETKDLKKNGSYFEYKFEMDPGKVYTIHKYAGVIHSQENGEDLLKEKINKAKSIGYDELYKQNQIFWNRIYDIAKVNIFNNELVSEQINYAVYQLIANRPYSDYVSVGKSGTSGQFHHGSVSWRTEILLLPFYINIDPISARHMVMYRINSLEEAQKKAQTLGYEGAFYANESGPNGYEINQYDIKNNIHINASIIYGIYQYIERTADYTVLFQGGMKMLLECAKFYLSYAKLSDNKKHFDFLNVLGLDDIHGLVNNEAYTNFMIKNSLDALIKSVAFAKQLDKTEATAWLKDTGYVDILNEVRELRRKLYVKKENIDNLLENFDNYFKLQENKDLLSQKITYQKRVKNLTNMKDTTFVKNPSILILQALFLNEYSPVVNKANYEYYIKRTIGPDYLTKILLIIDACENDYPEEAYQMLTELADLSLKNTELFKEGLNLGLLGGIYLDIVYGFAGLKHHVYLLEADYNSSKKIRRIEFQVRVVDNIARIKIKRNSVNVDWDKYTDLLFDDGENNDN